MTRDPLPVCTYCTVTDQHGQPYSSVTWDGAGYRHAAVTHAAIVEAERQGIAYRVALAYVRGDSARRPR